MLISVAELDALRAEIGPKADEGLFRLKRGAVRVASGAGFTKPTQVVVETVAGRATYVGNLNVTEKEKMGIMRTDADYMISLEAFTDVRNSDTLEEIAPAWESETRYFEGQIVVKVADNGSRYQVVTPGTSGSVEPAWTTTLGATFTDGTVVWRCIGPHPVYQIIQIMGPSTYGQYISTRVATTKQQL